MTSTGRSVATGHEFSDSRSVMVLRPVSYRTPGEHAAIVVDGGPVDEVRFPPGEEDASPADLFGFTAAAQWHCGEVFGAGWVILGQYEQAEVSSW